MKSIAKALAICALMFAGCSKVEDPTSVAPDQIISMKIIGPAALLADGVSTTTIQAVLPREATTRSVKFTTSRGSFLGTDGKQEFTLTADVQGIANATLVAGREAGAANVMATVGTFTAT